MSPAEGELVNHLSFEHVPDVKVAVAVVGVRIEGVLIVLEALASPKTRRIQIVEEVRPGVVDAELQAVAHALAKHGLKCVVVRDGVVGGSVDALKEWIWPIDLVIWAELALRNLIDVNIVESQIVSVVAHVGESGDIILAELPLQAHIPLKVLRQGRMELGVSCALAVAGIGGGRSGQIRRIGG